MPVVFPTMCAICLGPYKDAVSIPCGHIFCEECLLNVTHCPKCRRPFRDGIPHHTAIRRVFIDFDHMQVETESWPQKQRLGILYLRIAMVFILLLCLLGLNQQVNNLRQTCWCGTPWSFLRRLWSW
ncbi:hypothetical protein BDZ89DRAFT_796060 [Hymenopellis radicata]|nr:hypothetical protein BDZ89DRAFT_796060 [Hymenopellis radicata]